MKTDRFSALRFLFLVSLHFTPAHGSNVTDADPTRVGWYSGPQHRGTMTIVWTCFSTIVACTWTILHLNVPGFNESASTIFWRKVKWTAVTVLFPELIFAKAMIELQMAVEDLIAMKQLEGKLGEWKVECGKLARYLYQSFRAFERMPKPILVVDTNIPNPLEQQPKRRPTEYPPVAIDELSGEHMRDDIEAARSRPQPRSGQHKMFLSQTQMDRLQTWTLTHSYFANMGGLVQPRGINGITHYDPITAHALTQCCVDAGHGPFNDLLLAEADIKDKAKADWFTKALAIAQVLWLAISCTTRAVNHLPISQLELCTLAFAILASATYAANWWKPKGVEVPFRISTAIPHSQCEAGDYRSHSFFSRLLSPSKIRKAPNRFAPCRVENDFIRLGSIGDPALRFSWILTVSTALFGGFHVLGWRSHFTTGAEKTIWLTASILSATIPLFNLLVNLGTVSAIHSNLGSVVKSLESRSKSIPHNLSPLVHKNTREPVYKYGVVYLPRLESSGIRSLHYALMDTYSQYQSFIKRVSYHSYLEFCSSLLRVKLYYNQYFSRRMRAKSDVDGCNIYFGPGCRSQEVVSLDEGDAEAMNAYIPYADWVLLLELALHVDLHTFPKGDKDGTPERKLGLQRRILHGDLDGSLRGVIKRADRLSRYCTVVCGLLYAAARLLILALAFAALREQDERVYVETWAQNLPKIG